MQCVCVKQFSEDMVEETRDDLFPSGSEVVLRVLAAGVCHSDIHIRDGGYDLGHGEKLSLAARGMKLPVIMGHESVGVVTAVGPDAQGVEVGQKAVIYPWNGCSKCALCLAGRENYCATPNFIGIHCDGGYAEQVKVPHPRYLFGIGDIDPSVAAPYACSGLTTFSALKKVEDSLTSVPLVIFGAGGLGLTCISLIKALGGLPPIVVDIDPNKRAAAIKAGARAAIDGSTPDAMAQIQAAAGGAVPAIIDFVGNEQTAALAFDTLPKGGKLVIVGLFGGATPWKLPLIPLKAMTIMGSYMGSLPEFRELMEIALKSAIPPIPVTEFPLKDAESVLKRLERGEVLGRAILRP